MNFNTIKDLALLSNPDFHKIVSDPTMFFSIYAQRVSFYEWLQLYFSNKKFANTINALINYRHYISQTFLDLYTQSIQGENEFQLFKKIISTFPYIIEAQIDLDRFSTLPSEILSSMRNFKHLQKLTLYTRSNFVLYDRDVFIFYSVTEFSYFYRNNPNNFSDLSLYSLLMQMPNLVNIALSNFPLSTPLITLLAESNISEVYLLDVDSFNADPTPFLFNPSLKKLTLRFKDLSNEKANDLLRTTLDSFSPNSNIENFTFEITSSIYPIHFEKMFNLPKLQILNIYVSMRNMRIYYNLVRILFLIPYFNSSTIINLHLNYSSNFFDRDELFNPTLNIFNFISEHARNLQTQCANFFFFCAYPQSSVTTTPFSSPISSPGPSRPPTPQN